MHQRLALALAPPALLRRPQPLARLPGVRRQSTTSLDAFEQLVHARRSAGRFDPARPVPAALLERICALTLRSPSGFNFQPYTVVLVTDPAVRAALAEGMLGGNAARVAEAPVSAVFAADLQPLQLLPQIVAMEAAAGRSGRYLRGLPGDAAVFMAGGGGDGGGACAAHAAKAAALSLAGAWLPGALPTVNSAEGWAFKSVGLAAMTLMYAATAGGLASHAMEGLDARAVRAACRIPHDRYAIPLVVALGYPLGGDGGGGSGRGADGGGGAGGAAAPPPAAHARSPRLPLGRVFKLDAFPRALPEGGS